MAHTASASRASFSVFATLSSYVSAFQNWRTQRAQYLETTRELYSLDDRELNDLGIARSNIPAIAKKHVYDL